MTAAAVSCADAVMNRKGRRLASTLAPALALCMCVVLAFCAQDALAGGRNGWKAGTSSAKDFDFYVLSLSWSPSYCAAEGADANRQQCEAGRPYAFVVHGLWPQFERGYPSDCAAGTARVPGALTRSLLDIMPSPGLVRHEWQKHGTCTGLSQTDYFRILRAARQKVAIPDEYRRLDGYRMVAPQEVEDAFLRANRGLRPDAVAVTCDRRYLREVRICMTRDLGFRACPQVDRQACRQPRVVMPPVRGG